MPDGTADAVNCVTVVGSSDLAASPMIFRHRSSTRRSVTSTSCGLVAFDDLSGGVRDVGETFAIGSAHRGTASRLMLISLERSGIRRLEARLGARLGGVGPCPG